jgi:hypothetical protein
MAIIAKTTKNGTDFRGNSKGVFFIKENTRNAKVVNRKKKKLMISGFNPNCVIFLKISIIIEILTVAISDCAIQFSTQTPFFTKNRTKSFTDLRFFEKIEKNRKQTGITSRTAYAVYIRLSELLLGI